MTDDSEDDAYDAVDEDEFDGPESEDDVSIASILSTPASSLAARRAIDARREAREMQAELNYLELEIEDEE